MNPLMNSVGSNAEEKLNCINAVVITHESTVILIELRWIFLLQAHPDQIRNRSIAGLQAKHMYAIMKKPLIFVRAARLPAAATK